MNLKNSDLFKTCLVQTVRVFESFEIAILTHSNAFRFHPLLKRQLLAYLARVQLFLGCRRSNQIHFAPQEYTYSNGGGGSPHGTTKRAEKDIPKTINGDRLCIVSHTKSHFRKFKKLVFKILGLWACSALQGIGRSLEHHKRKGKWIIVSAETWLKTVRHYHFVFTKGYFY